MEVESTADDILYTNEVDYNNGLDNTLTCTSNSCMNNAMVGMIDRLLRDNGIATEIRSCMLDHVQHGTTNNTIHDNEMENCYLLGMKACCVSWPTMTRRLERIGSSHAIETHGELESRVCHSTSRRGLGTIIGLWKKHMHNQLNDRMTKAYRRGVTCTEKVRICLVSCLYPYLLASHLFERELE